MRVLVTRPKLQAEATAGKLVELGHEPELLPLSRAIHLSGAAATALGLAHSAIAITSAEAIRALELLGPLEPDVLAAPLFAVGAATAREARRLGFTRVHHSDGDGAELAALIDETMKGAAMLNPVLYLAGVPRASRFEHAMEKSGYRLQVAEIYEMLDISYPVEALQHLLVDRRIDVVLFFSRRSVSAFFELPIFATSLAALDKTLFLCLSHNIAQALPPGFKKKAVVAMTPDEEALLDLL